MKHSDLGLAQDTPTAILRQHEEKRLLQGHLWIFSNEINTIDHDSKGDIGQVLLSNGNLLGMGFFNPRSLISIRLLSSREENHQSLIRSRINKSNAVRLALGFNNCYRMVFGESDYLPGLVIDRFGDYFVVESYCAGMDKCIDTVLTTLVEDFHAVSVIEKSTSVWRQYEEIEPRINVLYGGTEETKVVINGISFIINSVVGQKTGFFLDQSANRRHVEELASGRLVLDCFCNDGGFSLHALRGGAKSVVGLDISEIAIDRCRDNMMLNSMDGKATFFATDVFDFLSDAKASRKEFDLIILDPPAFVKSKKSLRSGLKGYQKLNELAISVLAPNGILVSSSCSHHVSETMFIDILRKGALRQKREMRIIRIAGASADHPVHPAMPETRYLKCITAILN